MSFVGERVEVEADTLSAPRAIVWRGRRLAVRRVLRFWHDFSYGPYRYLPRRWWMRRRRLYFDVELEDGRVARIYRDFRRRERVLLCFLPKGEGSDDKGRRG